MVKVDLPPGALETWVLGRSLRKLPLLGFADDAHTFEDGAGAAKLECDGGPSNRSSGG